MKCIGVILIITAFIFMHANCDNKTIFLAQLTSEGARSYIGSNPIDKEWEFGPGEITSMGLRQQYLVGYDLKVNYAVALDLERKTGTRQEPLPIYSPWQVNIRSTNHNYTLMGAQAGLEALYPPDARDDLTSDQAKIAEPPGDNTSIVDDIKNLENKIMPNNFQTLPIHAMDFDKDTVLMKDWCQDIETMNKEEVSQQAFTDEISNKYSEALNKFKDLMVQDNLTIHEIYDYMDGLYTAQFNLDNIGEFGAIYDDLMKFRFDYYTQYWNNDQSRKVFANGFVQDLKRYLADAKEQYENEVLDNYKEIKMSLYYGTLESAYVISRQFGYNHTEGPLFSSQLLLELFIDDENTYQVKVMFNKQDITLGGDCGDKTVCELSSFNSLLQSMTASESQMAD